jgi:hypothetical protein
MFSMVLPYLLLRKYKNTKTPNNEDWLYFLNSVATNEEVIENKYQVAVVSIRASSNQPVSSGCDYGT